MRIGTHVRVVKCEDFDVFALNNDEMIVELRFGSDPYNIHMRYKTDGSGLPPGHFRYGNSRLEFKSTDSSFVFEVDGSLMIRIPRYMGFDYAVRETRECAISETP